jgi:hypothetical protein
LGAIAGDSLKTSQRMLYPYTYTQLINTEEPVMTLLQMQHEHMVKWIYHPIWKPIRCL